ncbi:ABC transporter ATP-binding protein [Thermoplasma sp.]|uniref:ABC transporter ATP-binding protein n=1 Tax=Thermoplasma sp. TaxID=1973142 RepID=UPI0026258A00|nr:ABC transporter ATP-binding protein [Thermoplasma sp.]
MKFNRSPIIEVENLSLVYEGETGNTVAIDNISFSIYIGSIHAIVGESGSGKSTLANALIGYIKYPMKRLSGLIKFNGKDIFEMDDEQLTKIRMKEISYVPQAAMNSLNPVITIRQEMHDIISAHAEIDKATEENMMREAINLVNLPEYVLEAYPHQLSGGMRQRVMIAIASVLKPSVIILDEPTTGLDVIVQKDILDVIKKINEKTGTTIVLITHDLPVAFYTSNRCSIIYSGKIVEQGDTTDIINKRYHPYTNMLISAIPSAKSKESKLNIIPGETETRKELDERCHFVNRCPYAVEVCRTTPLRPIDFDSDHSVLCLKYDDSYSDLFSQGSSSDKIYIGSKRLNIVSRLRNDTKHTIELKDVQKDYIVGRGNKKRIINAVRGIDLKIENGMGIAIVGSSGSGKTTIGKIMLYDETMTSGKYLFDGRDVTSPTKKNVAFMRKAVQMVFQDPFSSLSPLHKIGYQIARPLLINGVSKRETIDEDVMEILSLVGLRPAENFVNKYPHELSGGQRQRICFAKAISVAPKFLVADEPVSMLDASVRAEILNLMNDLKNELNLGLIYITHDLSTVRYVAEEVYVMHQGRFVEHGTWEDIIQTPSEEYTKKLLESIIW